MKKSLLALAVLGAFAGVASAQSSVTIFGIIDVRCEQGEERQQRRPVHAATDGLNSSRFGFRGVEDLGGGLSAGFWLEAGVAADTGGAGGSNGLTAPTNGSSNLFNRRSTVSLLGGWGELRLGRDYTPSFWNTTVFDPFGTNGVGSFLNLASTTSLGTDAITYVRANNSIGYLLPSNLGGLYGQVQVSARGTLTTATRTRADASATPPARSTSLYRIDRPMPSEVEQKFNTATWRVLGTSGS